MRLNRQTGFSLLELLVAMMIIAVIATLGFKKFNDYSAKARFLKAQDTLKTVGEGLDQYFLKHGKYPDLTTYEAMVEPNSPLVKENMLPPNMPAKDPWDQPYEAKSGKGNYTLKFVGDPNGDETRGPFERSPGRITGEPSGPATAAPGATPSPGPAK